MSLDAPLTCRLQIVKNGGDLMPEYDSAVTTHIVTDAPKQPLLRVLGLKSLAQIPHNIPTVKWTWVLSALSLKENLSQSDVDKALGDPFMHAAFSERIDAGCAPRVEPSFKFKSKQRAVELSPSAGTGPSMYALVFYINKRADVSITPGNLMSQIHLRSQKWITSLDNRRPRGHLSPLLHPRSGTSVHLELVFPPAAPFQRRLRATLMTH